MGSFGERLRREREMRGITIEEIAEATKIGSRNLRALEQEKFDLLPGGIFNKGFVRAYSKFLGLDEEQAVADYVAAESAFRDASGDGVEVPVERSSGSGKGLLLTIVVLLAIAGGGFGGWKYYQKRAAQRAEAQAATSSPAPQTAPVQAPPSVIPTATTQTAASTPPDTTTTSQASATPADASSSSSTPAATTPQPETARDGFVVDLKFKQDSWVSANADGKPVLAGTQKAADEKTLRARDRLVLKVGNLSGVQVSYNGKNLDLGTVAAGQVKTLVFTAKGLQPDAPEQR